MKKYIKYILFGLTLLLVIYLIYVFMTGYLYKPNDGNNINNNVISNNMVSPPETAPKVAEYMGYSYKLFDNYFYQIQKCSEYERLVLFDNVSHCGGNIAAVSKDGFAEGTFDSLLSLEKLLVDLGNNIKNGKIIERDGKKVFVYEHYYGENKGLMAYMDAYDNYIYQILVNDDDNTFNYEALDTVLDILDTCEKIEE